MSEFFKNLFNKAGNLFESKKTFLEDYFNVIITEDYIQVEHLNKKTEQIYWKNINHIMLINTDEGPWLPDVWLAILGDVEGCVIPQGAKGYDEVYQIVSKYKGFDLENVIKSMQCTDNAEFELWSKK